MKCYCEDCDTEYHVGKKASHKRKRIVLGRPFKARTTMHGDNFTFPKTFDWVTVHYKMHVKVKKDNERVRKRDFYKRLWNRWYANANKHGGEQPLWILVSFPPPRLSHKNIQSVSHIHTHTIVAVLVSNTYASMSGSFHFPFMKYHRARPVQFQAGCSGPCVHVQILNCADIHAADSNGFSDPYVAVWWKDTLIGTTR